MKLSVSVSDTGGLGLTHSSAGPFNGTSDWPVGRTLFSVKLMLMLYFYINSMAPVMEDPSYRIHSAPKRLPGVPVENQSLRQKSMLLYRCSD